MFRRAFLCCSAILAIAGIAGCLHSYTRERSIFMKHPAPLSFSLGSRSVLLNSWNGSIDIAFVHAEQGDPAIDPPVDSKHDFGLFEWVRRIHYTSQLFGTVKVTYVSAKIGYWLPVLLLAIYPMAALIYVPIRRRRRRRAGQCIHCGYDLRGAVDDRCSECGAAFDERPFDG